MRRERGFTLLELLLALAIFGLLLTMSAGVLVDATDQVAIGRRSLELRYLAESKLGEIEVFEEEFDEILEGDFRDRGEEFEGYEWSLDIRDVTVFGISNDENAPYYWPEDETAAEEDEESGQQQQQQGETQIVRELRLRVSAPDDEGATDFIEIVTLLPLVEYQGQPSGN